MENTSAPETITTLPTVNELVQKTNISQHSRKNILLLFSIFVTLLIVSTSIFFYLERQNRQQLQSKFQAINHSSSPTSLNQQIMIGNYSQPSPSPTSALVEYNYASSLEVPNLFPNLIWQKIPPEQNYWNDKVSLYLNSNDQRYFYEELILKGNGWYTEQKDISVEKLRDLSDQFRKYYEKGLVDKGWNNKINIPGYTFQAVTADLPGSTWGYIGATEALEVRVIVLEELAAWSVSGDGKNPGQCPCTLKNWVFVSNSIALEDLLELIKPN